MKSVVIKLFSRRSVVLSLVALAGVVFFFMGKDKESSSTDLQTARALFIFVIWADSKESLSCIKVGDEKEGRERYMSKLGAIGFTCEVEAPSHDVCRNGLGDYVRVYAGGLEDCNLWRDKLGKSPHSSGNEDGINDWVEVE